MGTVVELCVVITDIVYTVDSEVAITVDVFSAVMCYLCARHELFH